MHRATSLDIAPDTQARVRQVALELFTVKGYQSTSLRDLAAHLGMQAGSLYNHIENKQCLLFDLMEEAWDALLADTRAHVRRAKDPEQRLRLFVQAFVTFQSRERQRLALLNRESLNLSCEQRAHLKALADDYAQCLKLVVLSQSTKARDRLPGIELDRLVTAIIAMLQGLPLWEPAQASETPWSVVDQLTRMIGGAIGAARS